MTSPVTTWRYSVPSENGEGWAVLFLDSSGVFASVSDWGSYSYHWHSSCWPQANGFREFVIGRGDDYLMSKLAPEPQYDAHETLLAVKREIVRIRRGYEMTRIEARDEWDQLAEHDDLGSREEFHRWLYATDLGTIEAQELARFRPHAQAEQFLKRAWPRLREAIRVELEREAPCATCGLPVYQCMQHETGGCNAPTPEDWDALHKFSKAERGGTWTAAGGTANDLSEEKRAEGGSPSAAKSDPGDSSASPVRTTLTPYRKRRAAEGHCMSNSEGDCDCAECPQLRDDEPMRSGRHCPRDKERESC